MPVGADASPPVMRALVITESLAGGTLPSAVRAIRERRRYPYDLDGTRIEIIELDISGDDVEVAATALGAALLPRGWYAHLLDAEHMIVVFPGEVIRIDRGDAQDVARAQDAGRRVGVPMHQMRFNEMFDIDHPE